MSSLLVTDSTRQRKGSSVCTQLCDTRSLNIQFLFLDTRQARIQDFLKGGGVKARGDRQGGGVIAPVGEKLLFEHNKISATRGGVIYPVTPPLDPPLPVIDSCVDLVISNIYSFSIGTLQ